MDGPYYPGLRSRYVLHTYVKHIFTDIFTLPPLPLFKWLCYTIKPDDVTFHNLYGNIDIKVISWVSI